MRGLNRLAASPGRSIAAVLSPQPYSTFSGGDGRGRGRGRGAGSPPPPSPQVRVPGQPVAAAADEDSFPPSFGHGRGRLPFPSSTGLPSFTSLGPSNKPSSATGRGRPSSPPESTDVHGQRPKMPIFFRRSDPETQLEKTQFDDSRESAALPPNLTPILSGSGRGKPTGSVKADPSSVVENRHLRNRAQPIGRMPQSSPTQPKLGKEEAARRAVEILSGGVKSGPSARVRGGRVTADRGTRGGSRDRFRRGRGRRDADDAFDLYLGDNADGEKLEKRLGEEKMKMLSDGFEEICSRVLPSPMDEAYLDALHINNLIEYEPEYSMEFDRNPDIDEKPPITLEELLVTAKPFLMAYTGMKSQEEWEEAIEDLRERLPHLKELVDMYSGPDRVTAKVQQEELERLANTLPEKVPSSVRRFTDRAVLSLQSNPGWRFDKKYQFMDKLVRGVSEHYK